MINSGLIIQDSVRSVGGYLDLGDKCSSRKLPGLDWFNIYYSLVPGLLLRVQVMLYAYSECPCYAKVPMPT